MSRQAHANDAVPAPAPPRAAAQLLSFGVRHLSKGGSVLVFEERNAGF